MAQCRGKTWVERRESTLIAPVSHVVKGEAKELVFFVQSERRTKDDESMKKMKKNSAFGVGRFLALTFRNELVKAEEREAQVGIKQS